MLKNKKPSSGGTAGGADWGDLPDAKATVTALQSRGIFMDITGLEGSGKSSLALTVARGGKVAYLDIDQSVDRARKPKDKRVRENIKVLPVRYQIAMGLSDQEIMNLCAPVWKNAGMKLGEAVAKWASAAVIDTGTEAWELNRLAATGTLNPKGKRMDRVYGPLNARMRQLFRSVYRSYSRHLITIHQVGDEYIDKVDSSGEVKSIKTGRLIRKGFKEIGYLSDIVIRCFRDEKAKNRPFKAEIQICKLPPNGPDLEGMIIEEDQLDFYEIIALATDTQAEEWIKTIGAR